MKKLKAFFDQMSVDEKISFVQKICLEEASLIFNTIILSMANTEFEVTIDEKVEIMTDIIRKVDDAKADLLKLFLNKT